ncbi:MAG TPA: hypothetical protein VFQ82_05920 [Stellaceae bacterium]|jgi:hypothetical protein|nr:hypothetical protein [Stellaceae bacterium]
MFLRQRTRTRLRALAAFLGLLGLALWVVAMTLHVTPLASRDVAVGHVEGRSLGIVGGGAAVAAGIALFAITA